MFKTVFKCCFTVVTCLSSHLGAISTVCSQPSNVHHDFRCQLCSCDGLWIYRNVGVACILSACVKDTEMRRVLFENWLLNFWAGQLCRFHPQFIYQTGSLFRRFGTNACRLTWVLRGKCWGPKSCKCCLVQKNFPEGTENFQSPVKEAVK